MQEKLYVPKLKFCTRTGACEFVLDTKTIDCLYLYMYPTYKKITSMPKQNEKVYNYQEPLKFKLSVDGLTKLSIGIENVLNGKKANCDSRGEDKETISYHDSSKFANAKVKETKVIKLSTMNEDSDKYDILYVLTGTVLQSNIKYTYKYINISLTKVQFYMLKNYITGFLQNHFLIKQLITSYKMGSLLSNDFKFSNSSNNYDDNDSNEHNSYESTSFDISEDDMFNDIDNSDNTIKNKIDTSEFEFNTEVNKPATKNSVDEKPDNNFNNVKNSFDDVFNSITDDKIDNTEESLDFF
jgi:hypothetical protein